MSYDEELIEYLNNIPFSIIKDDERFFDLLESNFPFGFSTINWREMDNSMHKHISLSNDRIVARNEVLNFLKIVKEKSKFNDTDSIIILSDGSLKNTYSLKWSDFVQHFGEIIFLPQHTYIIPEDGSWCLNYTFEDDLFFGFSPNKDGCS